MARLARPLLLAAPPSALAFALIVFVSLSFCGRAAAQDPAETAALSSDITYDSYASISPGPPANLPPAATQLLHTARFDVAAIHPIKNNDYRRFVLSFSFDDKGNFNATGVSPQFLVSLAWGIRNSRIQGGPGWFVTDRYTVGARSDEPLGKQISVWPAPVQKLIRQQMLQALLKDRFQLRVHLVEQPRPVLFLELAKAHPPLQQSDKESSATPPAVPTRSDFAAVRPSEGAQLLQSDELTMEQLAMHLSLATHEIVLDRTGLTGKYKVNLTWSDATTRAAAVSADGGDMPTEAPALPAALQEQLGLKLVSGKAPVEILVVDKIERPSEN